MHPRVEPWRPWGEESPKEGPGRESGWAGMLCASLAVPSLLQAGGGTYHERAPVPSASPVCTLRAPSMPCAYLACALCLPSMPNSLQRGWGDLWERPHLCSSCSKSQGLGQLGRNRGSATAPCSLGSSPGPVFRHSFSLTRGAWQELAVGARLLLPHICCGVTDVASLGEISAAEQNRGAGIFSH